MSDQTLEIRSGGVVAVDTESLREAAALVSARAAECEEVAELVWRAEALVPVSPRGWSVAQAADAARAIAADLHRAADVYDAAEVHAARIVAEAEGDRFRVALLTLQAIAHAAVLSCADAAGRLSAERWWAMRHAELYRQGVDAATLGQMWPGGFFPPLLPPLAALHIILGQIARVGHATVERGGRMKGDVRPVEVTTLAEGPGAPPATLTEIAERIPGEGDSRVRVDRMVMADGSVEFAVYISGMQSFGFGGEDPFDMSSNLDLYSGERSVSYDAVMEALRQAGASAGDTVHAFGHSQGAMIASRLATAGDFVVPTLVTFGSPIQVDAGESVLAVALRHTDDPVVALSAGGLPGIAAARESLVVERVADPKGRVGDVAFGAHQMDEYAETAALVDGAADPRVEEVRGRLAHFSGAVSVESTVYTATRPDDEGPTA